MRRSAVDFYTVSAQKWLLGPASTGALYVAADRVEECRVACPSYFSWKLPDYELRADGGPLRGLVDAAGFGRRAARLLRVCAGGRRGPVPRARETADRCRALLLEHGAEVVTEPGQATLVTWRGEETGEVVERLAGQGVIVRDLPGRGLLRASCGFWTSDDDLERLAAGLST